MKKYLPVKKDVWVLGQMTAFLVLCIGLLWAVHEPNPIVVLCIIGALVVLVIP